MKPIGPLILGHPGVVEDAAHCSEAREHGSRDAEIEVAANERDIFDRPGAVARQ